MANIATQTTTLVNARAVGSEDVTTGIRHGGIYYPAHTKNGNVVSARWEGMIALNGKPYTNNQGAKVKGRVTFMRLVVWNGKNAAEGQGLADTFAKCVSLGKEISCNVRIESFDKRIFVNGQPVLDQQGSAITQMGYNFIFEDKLVFGADSNKVIQGETSRWNGAATFNSRPPLWNVAGHADQIAWSTTVVPARMNFSYKGGNVYGYARVIIPEGAQLLTGQQDNQQNNMQNNNNQQNIQNNNQQNMNTGMNPTDAANNLQMQNGNMQDNQQNNQQMNVGEGTTGTGNDTPL